MALPPIDRRIAPHIANSGPLRMHAEHGKPAASEPAGNRKAGMATAGPSISHSTPEGQATQSPAGRQINDYGAFSGLLRANQGPSTRPPLETL